MGFVSRTTVTALAAATAIFTVIGTGPGTSSRAFGVTNPPPVTKAHNEFSDYFPNISPGYFPSLTLTNQNYNAVNAFLEQRPAGSIRAVKVVSPLSNTVTNYIFNNPRYHVSYVFGDMESSNTPAQMKTLAQQVRFVNGSNNGTKTQSFNAFIGNFGMQDLDTDITTPANYHSKRGTHSFSGWTLGDFQSAKLNMSMPELDAGSPSYRNPAAGNSGAPNIRSALFTLPIIRLGEVKVNSPASEAVVPWIARFNNWNNLALDSDRNAGNGFRFVPGQAMPAKSGLPAVSAADTLNQMPSRRDFAAEVLHLRLRGADTFVTFEKGVETYFSDTQRADAREGFTESHVNSIFSAADHKLLLGKDTDYPGVPAVTGSKDFNSNIIEDGHAKSDEDAGALFSGVYSLTLKKMDVLLSNMDDDDHSLTLPPSIGGFTLKDKTFSLDGGSHLLVEYKLTTSGVNKGWSVMTKNFPFQDLPNFRNENGIPEPTGISLLALGSMALLSPRRRRKAN
jgi:hypothetical protein